MNKSFKKRDTNLLLINPPATRFHFGTAGLAYLKGYLIKHKIEFNYININQDLALNSLKFKKFKKILIEKIISSDNPFNNKTLEQESLSSLSYILASFSKNGTLYKSINNHKKLVEDIFIDYLNGKEEYIGISVSDIGQFVPALILSGLTKTKFPQKKIIFGGSLFVYYKAVLDFLKSDLINVNDYVDYIIAGEGESALLSIISKRPLNEVPNLIYWQNNKCFFSDFFGWKEAFSKDIPAPIYEKNELPQIQTSRMCYYNRCVFCSRKNFSSNFSFKGVEQVVEEFNHIKSNYKNKKISPVFFVDSCLPINFLKNFSRIIDNSKNKQGLIAFLRFEKELDLDTLRLMKNSGFGNYGGQIMFGLESSNDRLIKLVNKGINFKIVEKLIQDCIKVGINIELNFILNLPTQTNQELKNDLDYISYLLNLSQNINVRINFFELENFGYFFSNKEQYNLVLINNNFDLKIFLTYKLKSDKNNLFKYGSMFNSESFKVFLNFYKNLNNDKKNRLCLTGLNIGK